MNSLFTLPPAFVMIGGAIILSVVPRRLASAVFLVVSAVALVLLWTLPEGMLITVSLLSYELVLVNVDSLSRIFGAIFALITLAGGIYSFHLKEKGQHVAALFYSAGALGVTFAGDYITLFIFWELMAISSTYLIWARGTKESERAGMRYLLVHLFGGSVLLAGILMILTETGSTIIRALSPGDSIAAWLVLTGVALNAAVPPLHAWLADAYPKATVTGAVFMSALTTKSAVYVLARVFPGWEILILLGVIMALYGVVYAVLANDIREILAYHIISQVGYMVAGVGIGTELALNGTTAHAFSHILYKALLFMGAGAVLHTTGKSKLTELGGLARSMPLTLWLYMVGAFSISGFPLFNGFISKSMVVSAAGYAHLDWVYLLLTLASVGTFLHTGLKLPYFTWFGRDRGLQPSPVPLNMHIGMGIVAFLCFLFGVAPGLLYAYLPYAASYEPYTLSHLVEAAQILTFTFVGFWLMREKLAGEPLIALDTDWFYRKPAPFLQRTLVAGIDRGFDWVEGMTLKAVRALSRFAGNPYLLVERIFFPEREQSSQFNADRVRPSVGFALSALILVVLVLALLAMLSLGF